MDWNSEFDRQLTNLIAKNYPEAAHLSEAQFRAHCEPLKEQLTGLELPDVDLELGWCWEGNPHTWLGSASCGARVGV